MYKISFPPIDQIRADFGLSDKTGRFDYDKIIFNGPATIVIWKDGTKTISKCSEEEVVIDPEKGIAVCFMKRALGERPAKKVLKIETKKLTRCNIVIDSTEIDTKDVHPLKPETYKL